MSPLKLKNSRLAQKFCCKCLDYLCACDLCICLADFLTDICLQIWADTKYRLSNLKTADWLKASAANAWITNCLSS